MANTTSAKKAARKIARRTTVNIARRSRMRSIVRKVEEAIAGGDAKLAKDALSNAEPVIARAAQQGVIHRNTASRTVSRLAARVRKLG
jgi:small subunit ribosomal protein S20